MDEHDNVRRHQAPYGAHKPIPTVSKYREAKAARQAEALEAETEHEQPAQVHRPSTSRSSDTAPDPADDDEPMKNTSSENLADTSQVDPALMNPKQRRKQLKSKKLEKAEREVTDPVTHLPVTIQHFADDALERVASSHIAFTSDQKSSTGLSNGSKSGEEMEKEEQDLQRGHDAMQSKFPPPDFHTLNRHVAAINNRGLTVGITGLALIILGALFLEWLPLGRREQGLDPKFQVGNSWSLLRGALLLMAGAVMPAVRIVEDRLRQRKRQRTVRA